MEREKEAAHEILDLIEASFQPTHEYARVDEGDYPHLDLEYYREMQRRLEVLGYHFLCDVEDRTITETPGGVFQPIMLRALISRDGWTMAGIYHAEPKKVKKSLLESILGSIFNQFSVSASHIVDLVSEFENGHFVMTSNAEAAGMMASAPKVHSIFLPEDTDLLKVLHRHAKALARFQKKYPGVGYVAIRSYEEMVASGNRLNALKSALREEVGGVSREEILKMGGPENLFAEDVFEEIQDIQQERSA